MALTAAEHLAKADRIIAKLDIDNSELGLSRELQVSLAGLHIAAASCAAQIRTSTTTQDIAATLAGEPNETGDIDPWTPNSPRHPASPVTKLRP